LVITAVAAVDAASDGEVGEVLVVGAVGDVVADAVGLVDGGSASFSAQAETAANRSVPVARKVNPSRFFMEWFCFLSPSGDEARRRPAGGACIV
jgi:hypothetical protein